MTEERRTESLWSAWVQPEDDRRDGGAVSVGFEELHYLLSRDHQPDDLLSRWFESVFWAGYSKDFLRLTLLKSDIRTRFGGTSISVAPHNATSLEIQRVLREMGAPPTSVGGKRGNSKG